MDWTIIYPYQGFLILMEPSVTLHGRKKDHDVITKAAESAQKNYKEVSECSQKCRAKGLFPPKISGRDISFEVQGTLPDDMYVDYSSMR